MTYDEAVALHDNPHIKSARKLRMAAQRINESGREEDWPMVFRLTERSKRREFAAADKKIRALHLGRM